MTQQEFSISFDLYKQIYLTDNVEVLPSVGNWFVMVGKAKESKAAMRKFTKMIRVHDKCYNKYTFNHNSF